MTRSHFREYRGEIIGSFEPIIVDCPDPRALARFYSELLGAEIVHYDPERAELVPPGNSPPRWPGQDVPQQRHIEVKPED